MRLIDTKEAGRGSAMSTTEMPERNESGGSIRPCAECKWCQELIDSRDESIFFCVNYESDAYLRRTSLLGWCTLEEEEGTA